MYRIYDKPEAIKNVQQYLSVVGNPNIFVAKTGIYDENTRLSVINFQKDKSINQSGIVDKETFDLLYEEYILAGKKRKANSFIGTPIDFPIYPGDNSEIMIYVNQLLSNILNYHGKAHRIVPNRFYSSMTGDGVKAIRKIFLMSDENIIDELLYLRMIAENDSIGNLGNIL